MSSSVQLKRFNNTESKMDLTASQSDIGYFEKNKSCSTLVKVLLFVVLLTIAVAVAACVALAILINKQHEMETMGKPTPSTSGSHGKTTTMTPIPVDNTVCLTPECAVAAARVYQSIDQTVHPCDNFYDYACGKWIKSNPIPDDRSSVSTFSFLDEELRLMLKGMLESETSQGEIEAVAKAKKLYKSCVNEERIEERGLQPLQMIYDTYGKWPMLHNYWNESGFDLIDTMVAMRVYGSSPLIYQAVSTDYKNSTIRKLELDQPRLLLPGRDYYLSKANESIPYLRTYIVNLAKALGAENMSRVEQDVDDMLEFETVVANLTAPPEERRDINKVYKLMTIDDLDVNISDKFDWIRLVGGMMNIKGVEIPITGEEPIVVYSTFVYLRKLIDLIENTPKRVLANYLLATEIVSLVSALPKNIRDIKTEYNKALYGTQSEKARWKRCVGVANSNLGNAVGRLFVDNSFDDDAKVIALDMISNLRSAFNDLLTQLDWMDEETRKVAKEKADAIKENIGYSEKDIKNDTFLNEKYKDLSYDLTTYFENVLNNAKLGTVESLKKLRKPVDKSEWQTRPAIVNAFYSSTRNTITFPAGILQPPFFSKHYPKSMNFGGIGMVIGHEITHGFDDRGRLFDKNGDLKTWWGESVSRRFKDKAQCIVDQYSNFTVPEANMNLNGINTQGENIADNGGLKQAFTAYRAWVKKQGKEEQKLPGLHFNHNQLFFLNLAQIWCTSMRKQDAVNRILTGVHSPGKFRVLGPLQNSPDFSEAFNCPKTSYMNPAKKCRVW